MTEKKKTGWALFLLLIVGAGAFVCGLRWGLPSREPDKYFFSGTTAASRDSRNSYERSGAGIAHLAGDWDNDANRGADVASHPILDRSRPVTLVNNLIAFTVQQILKQGDAKLAGLVANEDSTYADMRKLSQNPESTSEAVNDAQRAYFDATGEVNKRVQEYNAQHIPDFMDINHEDSVNRARIVRRYRLYSDQPDEMNTLRALGGMHPGKLDFDPKLYQYGGLWIYPIGAILKAGEATGLLSVSRDINGYVDNPANFGPFYVVMRAYSGLWGLIAVIAVFFLVRRFTGGWLLPAVGGLCFIFMPVVLNMAHEGKPHLAGIALVLLSVLAASKYVQTGKIRWAVYTGLACGAAAGMVLSALCAVIVIPLMTVFRKEKPARLVGVCALGIVVAGVVYFASNPYVAIHLIHSGQPNALTSNMQNTKAMYQHGPVGESIVNAIRLIVLGASLPLVVAGVLGKLALLATARRQGTSADGQHPWARETGWLLAAVAIVVLIEFTLYAAGKPAEYARFGALFDVALLIAAVAAIGRSSRQAVRTVLGAILFLAVAIFGFHYLLAFEKDSGPDSSRIMAANQLNDLLKDYGKQARPVLGIYAEPAPFDLPPVDLYRWKIVLLPPSDDGTKGPANVTVKPVSQFSIFDPGQTPISWADTQFEIVKVK